MKRFLTYSTLFAAIVALLLMAAEAVVRHYPNSYRYKDEWMRNRGDSVTTLILGGSHSYYGLDPSLMERGTFNLANVSQHPEYDYYLLTRYPMPALQRVILVVDAVNVFDPPIEDLPDDRQRATYYRLYMGCGKHSALSRYGFELSSIESYKKKFRPAIEYLLTGRYTLACDSLGMGAGYDAPDVWPPDKLKESAKRAVERHRCHDFSNVDYNLAWLDSIGEYCKRRSVDIIVITPPVVPDYYNNVDRHQLDEMYRVARHVTERYGARYFDYHEDKRFVDTDFHDADHLAATGARKLTRLLLEDMRNDSKSK